ncbi:MAG TPA: HAD family hydrolase [Candidatus Hypogeohydataceae bacterium YC41]
MVGEIKKSKKIKAVIFDLDDTLYDCSGTLSRNRRRELARVVAKYKGCTEEEAVEFLQKDEEVRKYGRYEGMAHRLGLPPAFLDEIQVVLQKSPDLNQIKLFSDVYPTLKALRGKGLKVFLVTSGNCDEQEAKMSQLGLSASGGLMEEVMIVKRDGEGKAKRRCFQQLLEKYGLAPEEVLCVGDRIEDELAAATALGIPTVMLEHGQHYERFANSSQKEIVPDFFIKSIVELLSLI